MGYILRLVISQLSLLLIFSSISVAKINRIDEARAWVKRGETALKEGLFREALLAFEAADRYDESVSHKMMIAKVYEKMGGEQNCSRAIATWSAVLKKMQTQTSALTPRVEKKLVQLRNRCVRTITVQTHPPGARIWVEQNLVGYAPLKLKTKAGVVNIKAQFKGLQHTLRVPADQELVSFDLEARSGQAKGDTTAPQERRHDPKTTGHTSLLKEPIRFHAQLSCRTLIGDAYDELSSCQSRSLWAGDQFKFTFKSSSPIYLYVFLSNERDQHQMLFPRGRTKNLVPADQEVHLPSQTWFTLDEVGPVKEEITVIYARAPVPGLESLRSLNLPAKNIEHHLKSRAMTSLRGVVLDPDEPPTLSAINPLEDQTQFTGRDDTNRIEFMLLHQGPRPQ